MLTTEGRLDEQAYGGTRYTIIRPVLLFDCVKATQKLMMIVI